MTTPKDIQELVQHHLATEVICEAMPNGQRVSCLTPLDYPSGEGIVVWIEPHGGDFDVTDYGEALSDSLARPPQDHRGIAEQAEQIARLHGLDFYNERLVGRASASTLGETVWRVASAVGQIAVVADAFNPKRHHKAKEFVIEVERNLKSHALTVERERKLEGESGHRHTATIYIPEREAIVEPVGGAGNWNQVSTVYAKFGDLTRANGYRPFALVDDRKQELSADKANMLVQVSKVVRWSNRDEWIAALQGSAN